MLIGRPYLLAAAQNDLLRVCAWEIKSLLIDVELLSSRGRSGPNSAAGLEQETCRSDLAECGVGLLVERRRRTGTINMLLRSC